MMRSRLLALFVLLGSTCTTRGSYDDGGNFDHRLSGEYETDRERTTSQSLIADIQGKNVLDNLRHLTKKPHTAGTEQNYRVGEWIRDQWLGYGLQDVHLAEYDVLLSHPADYSTPNTVELLAVDGRLIYRSVGQTPPLVPEEQSDPGANITYNAYSASGTAEGELVYVNYASNEDFERLERMNVSVKGKIAIARYGMEWRGAKALYAQRRGAVGLIIYSDPAEACPPNSTDQDRTVYPHGIWMPEGGVQLGSVMNFNGDPLTPLFPAVGYTYRTKDTQQLLAEQILPSIPVQPISYGEAYKFLSALKGRKAPDDWQGGLNITYRIDQSGDNDCKVRLTVRANTTVGKIKNVIGFIEGSQEPDRYVIVGNHFDAWIYGAVDPNSGTAVMLEMSRAFMKVINETGWRPLRTIVFCAWDGEEHSLLGSTEWAEQYATILDRRAVAYLNVDLISGNETIFASGNPTLIGTAVTAAKRVPNPDQGERSVGRNTVYDTWIRKCPPQVVPGVPEIPAPDGGSDHGPFFSYLGVPVLDFRYKNLSDTHAGGSYPLYHTLYETVFLEEKLADPNNFAFHVATGQFWAEMARHLADSDFLPLNVDHYAIVIQTYVKELKQKLAEIGLLPKMKELDRDMEYLKRAVENMFQKAHKFHYYVDQLRRTPKTRSGSSAINIPSEMINSRLQQLERCFLNPKGGPPEYPGKRHVIFANDDIDAYASSHLPFVYAQVAKYEKAKNDQERARAYKGLREQVSIVHYSVECAISLMSKVPGKATLV